MAKRLLRQDKATYKGYIYPKEYELLEAYATSEGFLTMTEALNHLIRNCCKSMGVQEKETIHPLPETKPSGVAKPESVDELFA